MLNHAISPCNIWLICSFFFLVETIVFSIQSFIHCLGLCSPLWCKRWQAKEVKKKSKKKKKKLPPISFTEVELSHVKTPRHVLSQKIILEKSLGGPMLQRMEKSFYKPSFVKPSHFSHVKAGSRTELVADHHTIIWVTPRQSCLHTRSVAGTAIRTKQNI